MKKILLLLIGITYCLSARSQQLTFGNVVDIDLASVLKKISSQEAIAFAEQKYNNDETAVYIASTNDPDRVYYTQNNILISFSAGDRNGQKNYLSELKKGLDEMAKKDINYTSTLKKSDNNEILLISDRSKGVQYYKIYASNKKNTSGLNASILFNRADSSEVNKLLNEVLTSMNFNR